MRAVVKEAIIGVQEGEKQGRKKTGPKVGGYNPGAFKPGHDPRRHLRGPIDGRKQKSIEAIASEHAEEAVGALLDIINDPEVNPMARVTAANTLLDRGFGKSVDRQVNISLNEDSGSNAKLLTRDELLRRLSTKYQDEVSEFESKTLEHRTTIDVTPHHECEKGDLEGAQTEDTPPAFSEARDENVE